MRFQNSMRPSSPNNAPLSDRIPHHYWLLAALLVFTLLVLISAIAANASLFTNVISDKLLHLFAFALLAILIFNGSAGTLPGRVLSVMFAIGLLAALDEAIQSFMPYRDASLLDWYLNMLASLACTAVMVMRYLTKTAADKNPGA